MWKLFVLTIVINYGCYGQNVVFSDSSFFRIILNYTPSIDVNNDGIIQLNEASEVRELNLKGLGLSSVEDIRFFPNLKKINVARNSLTSLKLENLDSLEELNVGGNKIVLLELKNLTRLRRVNCEVNSLERIIIENIPNLESFNCSDNQLVNLDISHLTKLKYFTAARNKLQTIDVSHNPELIQIVIDENDLTSIDISHNEKLQVNIMYIDSDVKIIGTSEQLKTTTARKGISW
jgi:Leucine-rich repeat (LRR) protein